MSKSTTICIKDKSGKELWSTTCSVEYCSSEIKNLQRHLDLAAKYPDQYHFLDLETAHIYQDGERLMTNNELLAQLGL